MSTGLERNYIPKKSYSVLTANRPTTAKVNFYGYMISIWDRLFFTKVCQIIKFISPWAGQEENFRTKLVNTSSETFFDKAVRVLIRVTISANLGGTRRKIPNKACKYIVGDFSR
jgi:hypothetical protein